MIQLLDAGSDGDAWTRILAAFDPSLQDVYHTAAYADLHRDGRNSPVMFVYEDGGERWVHPFVLRDLSALHIPASGDLTGRVDLESCYGYGGPLSTSDGEDFLRSAHEAFSAWCRDRGVVAEFVRLHPFIDGRRWLDPGMSVSWNRTTVSIATPPGGRSPSYDKDARYMLRRAERAGLTAEIADATPEAFERFTGLYLAAMARLEAAQEYYFSSEYFRALAALVRDSGWLIVIRRGEEWICAATVLRGQRWGHYHLAASATSHDAPGGMNLLIDKATQVIAGASLERLHLGGGRGGGAEDALLAFKRSMASDSHDFFIASKVHDPDLHVLLRERWAVANPALAERYGARLLCYHYHSG